ncbi:hypothetical protein ACHHYP_06612 [Achlya hypogyna]|uniref:Ion transport domain-containing protein n=1 Tax=Achlya hypogyna TaxID=1202772 RepID=A0A1V9YT84_ACHHY|nr:hypothetical protein ACHHYP_06612 [Achlya hypogyna]
MQLPLLPMRPTDVDDAEYLGLPMVDLVRHGLTGLVFQRLESPTVPDADFFATSAGLNVLTAAVVHGRAGVVAKLLHELDCSRLPDYAYAPVYYAVKGNYEGMLGVLRACIPNCQFNVPVVRAQCHFRLDMHVQNGENALCAAAASGSAGIMEQILSSGIDANGTNEAGESLLYIAAASGNVAVVELLLRSGAAVDQPSQVCEELLEACTTPKLRSLFEAEAALRRDCPVHRLVTQGDPARLLAWLAAHGGSAVASRDDHGRTAPMVAALVGKATMLEILLPHCDEAILANTDADGFSALDLALRRPIQCKHDAAPQLNAETLRCIELLGGAAKASFGPPGASCSHSVAEVNLGALAAARQWDAVETQLHCLLSESDLSARSAEVPPHAQEPANGAVQGHAVVHYLCVYEMVDLFRMLASQEAFDPHLATSDGAYPLYLAATKPSLHMVRRLVRAGADPGLLLEARHPHYERHRDGQLQLVADAGCRAFLEAQSALRARWPLFHLARARSDDAVRQYEAAGQSPLHVALLERLPVPLFRALVHACGADGCLNRPDNNHETPLMLAVARGMGDHARCLMDAGANTDAASGDGRTPLMVAALQAPSALQAAVAAGIGVHQSCLPPGIDWASPDLGAALQHPPSVCAVQGGASADCANAFAKVRRQLSTAERIVGDLLACCADVRTTDAKGRSVLELVELRLASEEPAAQRVLLRVQQQILQETELRARSRDHRRQLARSLAHVATEEAFAGNGFRKAVAYSPELARAFLTDCVDMDRRFVRFQHLQLVYGASVKESALYAIMHDRAAADKREVLARCLDHAVVRRVLAVKWELFARRKYLEGLLQYGLLLVTMTLSAITFDGAAIDNPVEVDVVLGTVAIVFTTTAMALLQGLRPTVLQRLAVAAAGRDDAAAKCLARRGLVAATVVITAVVAFAAVQAVYAARLEAYYPVVNNVVLAGTAATFVVTECRQWRVEGAAAYFASGLNRAQLFVYVLIVVYFAPMKLGFFGSVQLPVQIGVGGVATIFLWVVSLEFLEVVPSANHLLPLIGNLMGDIRNFAILLAVFQLGVSCTYYQIFVGKGDAAFDSLPQAFFSAYCVLFGQLPTASLDSLPVTDAGGRFLYGFTVLLMMFHAAAVVIILMNLLIASMNKTVDDGLESAQTQALHTYARAILRIELLMNLSRADTSALMYVATDAAEAPLLATNATLHPLFTEPVPKVSLELSAAHEAELQVHVEATEASRAAVEALKTAVLECFDGVGASISALEHYTSEDVATVYSKELVAVEAARQLLQARLALVRGRRAAALVACQSGVRDILSPFVRAMGDTHGRCSLLYARLHRTDLYEKAATAQRDILRLFDAAIDSAEKSDATSLA